MRQQNFVAAFLFFCDRYPLFLAHNLLSLQLLFYRLQENRHKKEYIIIMLIFNYQHFSIIQNHHLI